MEQKVSPALQKIDSIMRFTHSQFRKFEVLDERLRDYEKVLRSPACPDAAILIKAARYYATLFANGGNSRGFLESLTLASSIFKAVRNMADEDPELFTVYEKSGASVFCSSSVQFHPFMAFSYLGVDAALSVNNQPFATKSGDVGVKLAIASKEFDNCAAICVAGFASMEAARLNGNPDMVSFFNSYRVAGGMMATGIFNSN